MRFLIAILSLCLISVSSCAPQYRPEFNTLFVQADAAATGDGTFRSPFVSLQTAIDSAKSGDRIVILSGTYSASPTKFTEGLCGNCLESRTPVEASYGFVIKDKTLSIEGINADSVVLITNAGYGVLFMNSWGSTLQKVRVTGGVRDADGNATDAAIVAKLSRVTIRNCEIVDNDNRDTTVVVGIGGIFAREGSELFIEDNRIINGGWDGIALYRGAKAFIADNVISKGRGAGIGVTWDGQATVLRNRVSEFWKGIGSFGTSRVIARNNIVQDCLGWGMIATGESFMEATNNLIYRNGNCGFANWGDRAQKLGPRGVFSNNIVYNNGWRAMWVCPCVGVWMLGNPNDFVITNNNIYVDPEIIAAERANPSTPKGEDVKWAANYQEIADLTGKLGNISVNPLFTDTVSFRLLPSSLLINAGDTVLTDMDGSRSDIGIWGGSSAGK
jgi:hypothetical protein